MLPKNFETELKIEIKHQIIEYYDRLKNEIDINTAKCLIKPSDDLDQDKIHDLNERFIKIINDCANVNLQEVDDFFQANKTKLNDLSFYEAFNYSEENFTRTILSKHCFYIPRCLLKCKDDNELGVLIQSDWYLNTTEKNLIRYDD